MTKLWFILVLQLLAAAIVFFTTEGLTPTRPSGQIFSPERRFFLTKKGIILVLIFSFIIGVSIWQEVDDQNEKIAAKTLSDNELKKKDSLALIQQSQRDSIAFNRLQKSKEETIKALAIYGLKYDESQKRIEKLVKDSSRSRITNIVQQNDPVVGVCTPDGIQLKKTETDNLFFNISLCYKYSPLNLKVDLYAVSVFNGNWRLMGKLPNFIVKHSGMEIDGGFTSQLVLTNRLNVDKVFIRLTGTYERKDKKDKIILDEVYSYQISTSEFGFAVDKIKDDIIKFTDSISQ